MSPTRTRTVPSSSTARARAGPASGMRVSSPVATSNRVSVSPASQRSPSGARARWVNGPSSTKSALPPSSLSRRPRESAHAPPAPERGRSGTIASTPPGTKWHLTRRRRTQAPVTLPVQIVSRQAANVVTLSIPSTPSQAPLRSRHTNPAPPTQRRVGVRVGVKPSALYGRARVRAEIELPRSHKVHLSIVMRSGRRARSSFTDLPRTCSSGPRRGRPGKWRLIEAERMWRVRRFAMDLNCPTSASTSRQGI